MFIHIDIPYNGYMEKQGQEVDIHLLELSYSHTRIIGDKSLAKMQISISCYGQIVPVLVVNTDNNRFILIDGYLRLKGLQACGHDCIHVQLFDGSESDALFMQLANNNSRDWEIIEESAIIQELHIGFKYSFSEIGKRIGKDKSFIKRRFDLLTGLPEEIRLSVMRGKISAWSASHVLVPLSRVNEKDACKLSKKIEKESISTRELVLLYDHYKKSNRLVKDRIISDPSLFIKAVSQQKDEHDANKINDGPEGKWLKDITIVCHILKRLLKTAEYVFYPKHNKFEHRQRQVWIEDAEKYIVELKQISRRKDYANPNTKTDDSGDAR